jgi:hypothetical protein
VIHLSFSFAKLSCVSAPVLRTVCLLVVLVLVVEPLWTTVLVRVVLICTLVPNVMLVVHVFAVLFGMALSLYSVILIHSLGLGKLVDLAAHEASEKFLGELVRDGLACTALGLEEMIEIWRRLAFLPLVVLEEFHALEGGCTCDQLMRELRLVVVTAVALIVWLTVYLLMSVLSIVCRETGQSELPTTARWL